LQLGSAESGVDRRWKIAKTAMRFHRVVVLSFQIASGFTGRRDQARVQHAGRATRYRRPAPGIHARETSNNEKEDRGKIMSTRLVPVTQILGVNVLNAFTQNHKWFARYSPTEAAGTQQMRGRGRTARMVPIAHNSAIFLPCGKRIINITSACSPGN